MSTILPSVKKSAVLLALNIGNLKFDKTKLSAIRSIYNFYRMEFVHDFEYLIELILKKIKGLKFL